QSARGHRRPGAKTPPPAPTPPPPAPRPNEPARIPPAGSVSRRSGTVLSGSVGRRLVAVPVVELGVVVAHHARIVTVTDLLRGRCGLLGGSGSRGGRGNGWGGRPGPGGNAGAGGGGGGAAMTALGR